MTTDDNSNAPATGVPDRHRTESAAREAAKLPGLMAISVYMILLAVVAVVDVVKGFAGRSILSFPSCLLPAGWACCFCCAGPGLSRWPLWRSWQARSSGLSRPSSDRLLVQGLLNLVSSFT